MKKVILFVFLLLIIFFGICVYNTIHFEEYVNPNETNMYLNKKDIVDIYEKNEKLFNDVVNFFEKNYDNIVLNYGFVPPKVMLSEIGDNYIEYIDDYFENTDEVKDSLGFILKILKFTDFIIEKDHIYYFQIRALGETKIGLKYDPNSNNRSYISKHWYFYYKRDYSTYRYVGRWLYDFLYNNQIW